MKMKILKKTALALGLTTTLVVSNPAMAIFGIGDVVFDPTQAANMITEFQKWKDQFDQMNAQIEKAKDIYNSATGVRGYGNFMNITNEARNYLPKDFTEVMNLLSTGEAVYSRLSSTVRQYMDNNAVLTTAEIDKMRMNPEQRDAFMQARTNTATLQAMADEALQNASVRFGLLQRLAQEINETTDPKAIAELQARIQVEQNMLTNEQTKLQELAEVMESRRILMEQNNVELAIKQTGNMSEVEQPDLSDITFN
jgi:type IV secretion system protein VirB5